MTNYLHILNGDSTLRSLDKAGIEGDRIVWRDVLCEGPVLQDFASQAFWKSRTSFMKLFFGAEPKEFNLKCKVEFEKIRALDKYEELILWFEYDLFCQINMLAILHYLSRVEQPIKVSLICAGEEIRSKNLVGLGEIDPKDYSTLFDDRSPLNQVDLDYASTFYLTYCGNNPNKLIEIPTHDKFPYLKRVFDDHARRFPYTCSGLNRIEIEILQIIKNGVNDAKLIVKEMLLWQKNTLYGFGDTQYFIYLKMLKPLYDDDFSLNESGQKVLSGEVTAFNLISRDYYLGGVKVCDFVWNDDKRRLEEISS